MADLIDRQAAIDALHGYFDGMLETDTWSPCDVYGLIEILPSEDAIEVVWCKDCKHSYETVGGRICSYVCSYGVCVDCVVRDDFYCSYGEKNDG
jgi:hypothetical protein